MDLVCHYIRGPSIDKIGEVRLSDELGEGGFKILKKLNFIIPIRYEIPTFSLVGPFFEEGGRGSRKFRPEAEILGIFSIEVAPNWNTNTDRGS